MYKQMIPADVFARETRSRGLNHERRERACSHEVLAAQSAEAASRPLALQEELASENERYLRLAAEFENFKKRAAQELERRATAQKDALVHDLLPVIDNLERAVVSAPLASIEQVHQGIQMIWRQLIQVMRQHGFEMREDVSLPFDPKYHDAVSTRADAEYANHAVLEVWCRGWLRGNDLFRPAKVVVNQLNDSIPTVNSGQ
jgi:molecular chaperone GrpE